MMAITNLALLTVIFLMSILRLKLVNSITETELQRMPLQDQKLYVQELLQIREARKQVRMVQHKDLCQSRWLSLRSDRKSRAQENCLIAYNYFVTLPPEDRANCINPDWPDCRKHPNYERRVCTFMCDLPEDQQVDGCWPFDCGRVTAEPKPLGVITISFGFDPSWLDQYTDPTCWYTAGRGPGGRRLDSPPRTGPEPRWPTRGESDVDSKADEYIREHDPQFARADTHVPIDYNSHTPSPQRKNKFPRAETDIDDKAGMYIATAKSKMEMQTRSRSLSWRTRLKAPIRLLSDMAKGFPGAPKK